jgi:hypothetical protein
VVPGTNVNVIVKDISPHEGAFTPDQRDKFFKRLPAVMMACLGTSPTEYMEDQSASGNVRPHYVLGCYVFGRRIPTGGANVLGGDVAQAIAEAIAADVQYARPDASSTSITRFRMDNAWEAVADQKDCGAWVLTWEEGAEISPIDQEDLPDLITIRTELELAENGDEPQAVGNVTFDGVDDPDVEP